jgi:hypothetical protein
MGEALQTHVVSASARDGFVGLLATHRFRPLFRHSSATRMVWILEQQLYSQNILNGTTASVAPFHKFSMFRQNLRLVNDSQTACSTLAVGLIRREIM